MGHMSFVFYVNKRGDEMREKLPRHMMIQDVYDNAKTWDKVLAKLDHLIDREPNV